MSAKFNKENVNYSVNSPRFSKPLLVNSEEISPGDENSLLFNSILESEKWMNYVGWERLALYQNMHEVGKLSKSDIQKRVLEKGEDFVVTDDIPDCVRWVLSEPYVKKNSFQYDELMKGKITTKDASTFVNIRTKKRDKYTFGNYDQLFIEGAMNNFHALEEEEGNTNCAVFDPGYISWPNREFMVACPERMTMDGKIINILEPDIRVSIRTSMDFLRTEVPGIYMKTLLDSMILKPESGNVLLFAERTDCHEIFDGLRISSLIDCKAPKKLDEVLWPKLENKLIEFCENKNKR